MKQHNLKKQILLMFISLNSTLNMLTANPITDGTIPLLMHGHANDIEAPNQRITASLTLGHIDTNTVSTINSPFSCSQNGLNAIKKTSGKFKIGSNELNILAICFNPAPSSKNMELILENDQVESRFIGTINANSLNKHIVEGDIIINDIDFKIKLND